MEWFFDAHGIWPSQSTLDMLARENLILPVHGPITRYPPLGYRSIRSAFDPNPIHGWFRSLNLSWKDVLLSVQVALEPVKLIITQHAATLDQNFQTDWLEDAANCVLNYLRERIKLPLNAKRARILEIRKQVCADDRFFPNCGLGTEDEVIGWASEAFYEAEYAIISQNKRDVLNSSAAAVTLASRCVSLFFGTPLIDVMWVWQARVLNRLAFHRPQANSLVGKSTVGSDWVPPTEELVTRRGQSLGPGDRIHVDPAEGLSRLSALWRPGPQTSLSAADELPRGYRTNPWVLLLLHQAGTWAALDLAFNSLTAEQEEGVLGWMQVMESVMGHWPLGPAQLSVVADMQDVLKRLYGPRLYTGRRSRSYRLQGMTRVLDDRRLIDRANAWMGRGGRWETWFSRNTMRTPRGMNLDWLVLLMMEEFTDMVWFVGRSQITGKKRPLPNPLTDSRTFRTVWTELGGAEDDLNALMLQSVRQRLAVSTPPVLQGRRPTVGQRSDGHFRP